MPSYEAFTDDVQQRSIVYQGPANDFLSVIVEQRHPASSKQGRSVRFRSTDYSEQVVYTRRRIVYSLPLSCVGMFPLLIVHMKKRMVSFSTLLTIVHAWAIRYYMPWAQHLNHSRLEVTSSFRV